MKVIKKINNNFAICLDGNNQEMIAYGSGIGFPKIPYELTDLSIIDRTFYGIDSTYINLINELPESILIVSSKIVGIARTLIDNELDSNIVFTLADHINFAIKRNHEKMNINLPFAYEISHLYEREMDLGKKAVKLINEQLNVNLPREEAASIALHFINSKKMKKISINHIDEFTIIKEITEIIEETFSLSIDKEGFNYSRFVSHLQYLLKRHKNNIKISSDNHLLFETMKNEFNQAYLCSVRISDYLSQQLDWDIGEEELLYMVLHINRLCI